MMMLRLATHAMATRFELVLPCNDGVDESRLRAAAEAALEEIEECDRRLSAFRRDSLVSHINRVGYEHAVRLDEDTFALFADSLEVHRASAGALDIGLGVAMSSAGFRADEPGEDLGVPAEGQAFELDPEEQSVRLLRSGAAIDLGAVGKGHALDAASRCLREAGVECALLHGGTSTVQALGSPPGLPAWKVAIEDGPGAPVACLVDAALSVSAPHGRLNSRGQGHLLDPHSGAPVERDGLVAVISESARVSDLWSTALFVLGELPRGELNLDALWATGPPGERRFSLSRSQDSSFELTTCPEIS